METLGKSRLQTFLSSGWNGRSASNYLVRRGKGYDVRSFPSLARNVAHLSFYNRDQVLLFRGQGKDYRSSKGNTTIQPAIFRGRDDPALRPWNDTLFSRYDQLRHAESLLVEAWDNHDLPDKQRIERHRSLRWAVLQHYEICATPLLDVSQSLRVAASFALASASDDEAYLYVLAVPQISGAITASAEAELQILRLSSICPPSATRPHFQEGYLLGHYPELQSADEKQRYALYEVDFARRLLCKFRLIELDRFWRAGFEAVPRAALFPDRHDPLVAIAGEIKAQLSPRI